MDERFDIITAHTSRIAMTYLVANGFTHWNANAR
jgi:hypothetical protein